MEANQLPGFYPETPAAATGTSSRFAINGHTNTDTQHSPMGSIGRAGGPIRRTPATAMSRARAYSTPYARPPPQNTPGSGGRPHRDDEDEVEYLGWDIIDEQARIKKSLGEKTAELVGNLVSGVKDWFSSSKTPRREHVQSVVPRKKTPQRSLTSRMEEGLEDDFTGGHRESDNMFSPSLQPHYAGHTPWIVKQRTNKGLLSQEPPIFPLPNTNPTHRRSDSQSKYATLPAKRSNALVPVGPNKRPRLHGSSSSLRPPKEWELSKDRFAEQDEETLAWCDKHGIDIVALANGTQKRPLLPSFQDIQRYDALRNDAAFFERQGIRSSLPAHQPRNPSHLRHATSSYELSRPPLPPVGDSTSSKLHAWRELVRLKDAKTRADRETAQLERSKARNGYPSSHRTWSRNSSRVRGPAGDVGDDVWILPSVRPGSAGSMVRSIRMRTSSPQGSMRSQGGRGRPRGRDVFDEGVQTGPAGLLAPPPVDSRGMSVERNEREDTPRRKRPGYFSAREEDLDPLDMDVEDFITPAKKKQRLSVQSGPKFAALWEPSKRENWPLGDDSEKMEEDKKKVEETVELKAQKELQGLESPAFKLPPSARKERESIMEMEQSSPTREVEKPSASVLQFSKPATNGFAFTAEKTTIAAEKSPEKPSFGFSTDQPAFSSSSDKPTFGFTSPLAKPVTAEKPDEPKETPSKTATFMQSILSESKTSPEKDEMEEIPTSRKKHQENGVQESQPSPPKFQFSLPPTQTSISTSPPKSPVAQQPSTSGGFQFGGTSSGFSFSKSATPATFSFQSSAPTKETPAEEPLKAAAPAFEAPKFSFGQPKPATEETKPEVAEEKKEEKSEEAPKPAEPKPATPLFSFGKPLNGEAKEVTAAPAFGSSTGGFGSFGGAFSKPEADKPKLLFGATPAATSEKPATTSTETPATNRVEKNPDLSDAPTMPLFGGGMSSGFKFGVAAAPSTTDSKVEVPAKPSTPTPVASASAVPQDMDDSMDITDSPPAGRNPSIAMTDANVPFGGFKLPAPTSAPTTTEPPKALLFSFTAPAESKPDGVEKPTLPSISFGAVTSDKSSMFGGAPAASTSPAFGSPAASPAPSGFGGFGSAFGKKEEPAPSEKPAPQRFSFQSTSNAPTQGFGTSSSAAPAETKPLFGSQPTAPTSAPPFGGSAPSLFGGASGFQPQPTPTVTSPPVPNTAPPATSSFSFNFNAPSAGAAAPTFGSSSTPFTFGGTGSGPINNPFAAQSQPPTATTPGFQGISSAPVSPQNQQLATFPSVQSPFGSAPGQSAPLFGGSNPAAAPNFQFSQNLPASPVFTLGANTMQRSSSDAGPNNASPAGRRIAQPRRRLPRR